MATQQIIQRIATSPVLFAPTVPDFTGYVAQQLGDLGTAGDGFDAIFAGPAGSIDGDINELSTFDALLNDVSFTQGEFASTYFTPVDSALPEFLSAGDQLNKGVQAPPSATGAPTITPAPNPPSTQPAPPAPAPAPQPTGGGSQIPCGQNCKLVLLYYSGPGRNGIPLESGDQGLTPCEIYCATQVGF